MEHESARIKLTQTVQKGGCAAKVAAAELRKILSQVQFPKNDDEVLVDGGLFDDAAIYKVSPDLALVQTLDFFTPIVDSPKYFGKIAAANALSDVYAMGGEPKTAMAILAFPLGAFNNSVIVEVLQGASDLMASAGVNFVGGHSIDDDTLKFGLSVTGYVHPNKVWSNSKARVGDVLILTKPLGTGTVTAALKKGVISEEDMQEELLSMASLNRVLDLLSAEQVAGIHSATDITGFGLLGHLSQMAKASAVTMNLSFSQIPVFARAWGFIQEGFLTKAHRTNAEYTAESCEVTLVPEERKKILYDPQTSGGLLLSVREELSQGVLKSLQQRFLKASVVGKVESQRGPSVRVQA